MFLYKLSNLVEAEIINRPSKLIKSPYVADIQIIEDQNQTQNTQLVLAHSASLGCCGLADKTASVLVCKKEKHLKKNNIPKNKAGLECEYTIYLAKKEEKGFIEYIGIYPKLAEILVEQCIIRNCLTNLQNIQSFKKETVIKIKDKVDSRFDFTGIDKDGIPFIMEVKNVPLADYEDVTQKERIKMQDNFINREYNSKVAYFPDGYRKSSFEPVSERALKHINELAYISEESQKSVNNKKIRCIMCYVIQRTDIDSFQPSVIDPYYREAFINAINKGVEIITLVIKWNEFGEAYFIKDNLFINKL
jgi:DNA-binding sugar fermentation-stimulating protein